MEMKRLVFPFTVTTKADDTNNQMGIVEGYGSVFGNVDLGDDIIANGAFDATIRAYKERGEMPQCLGFHQSWNLVGDWLEMSVDGYGLKLRGELWVKGDKRIEAAVVCHNLARGTGPKGLSIGFVVKKYHYEERDGREIRVIDELELYEVSIVGWAMNPKAMITNIKSLTDGDGQILDKRNVEKILRDAGLSRRQSKAFIAGGYDALIRDEKSDVEFEGRDDSLDMSDVLASINNLSLFKG